MTAVIIGLVGSLRQRLVQPPAAERLRPAAGTIVHARDPRPRRYTVVRWRCRDTERSAGGGHRAKGADRSRRGAPDREPGVQQRHSRPAQERHRLAVSAGQRHSADLWWSHRRRDRRLAGPVRQYMSAQQAWLPIFRTLGVVPYFGRLLTVAAAQCRIRPGWQHRRRRDAGASPVVPGGIWCFRRGTGRASQASN